MTATTPVTPATIADVMTPHPTGCTPLTPLSEVARIMREHDCGIVPIVEDTNTNRLMGVVTDRDIIVRLLADGRCPLEATAQDAMTCTVHALTSETPLNECRSLMESQQVRRIPVVDANQALVGIVSLSDIAEEVEDSALGRTLTEISEPDQRQLYSEVHEHNRTGGTITPVQDPTERHPVG